MQTQSKTIETSKTGFIAAKERLIRALESTDATHLNWSPSETSRTPLEIATHAAMTISGFHRVMQGGEFKFSSFEEADKFMRSEEKKFVTKDQVLQLLEKDSKIYLDWIDELREEDLGKIVTTPFFSMTIEQMIILMHEHVSNHAAQIDYVQTIYGDQQWH